MANETLITIIGNIVGDPEIRQAGQATVANFTIASTPRKFNNKTNEWVDEETLFLRSSAWRDHAENIGQQLHKGTRVIAQGFLKQRSYETKEGEKRTAVELDVQEIGILVPRNKLNTQRAGHPTANRGGGNNNHPHQPDYPVSYDPNAPF